jgi:hypothetical protein
MLAITDHRPAKTIVSIVASVKMPIILLLRGLVILSGVIETDWG